MMMAATATNWKLSGVHDSKKKSELKIPCQSNYFNFVLNSHCSHQTKMNAYLKCTCGNFYVAIDLVGIELGKSAI